MTGKRRGHGEGAIYRRHMSDCPPAVDGERPDHPCRGGWVAQVDLGFVDGKRKRKTVYGTTRKEAAIKLQEAQAAKKGGTLVVGRVTVETWLRYWLDVICVEEGLKTNTLRSHRSKVEQYLIPHLGHLQVDRLETEHVRAMYAALRDKGLADSTISQTHAILRRALAAAVRERKAGRNIAADIPRPKAERVKREGLTLADARKVLKAAGDDPRFYLALYLGLRQGEVLALRWSHVNLDEGWLFIEHSLAAKRGGGFVFEQPKTKFSVRVLPIPTPVRSRLAVKWAHHIAAGGSRDDLVFGNGDRPRQPRTDYQQWRNLLADVGVPHVALHAARNTAATLLRAEGASDRDVADILGHSTVEMTRHYQGDDLEIKRRAVAALEAALGDEA